MAKKKKDKKKDKKKKGNKAGAKTKAGAKKKAETKKAGGKKSPPRATKSPLRALAQRIVSLTTANDDEAAFDLYAADVESSEMGMPPMKGLDAIREKLKGWREMVSDPEFKASNVWVDGNTIVIEWIGDVTLRANGKRAQLREIAVHEIEDGKIARERYYYDPSALQP